ncbi:hypothetical protein QEZ40_002493 [Streptomyces katrae]|uniref:Secreted protein n=1 Tax=Streptomyces katrae TaxID=68223 RepID=A0ABT7GVA5_9ACTN|nr:hypothetical protein [Streptomyces katrae]MDK9497552.1 hypothetical protein [Streptomyces katrae]
MSTPEVHAVDSTFRRLFAHAGTDAAALVAPALPAQQAPGAATAEAVEEQWRAPRAGDFARGVWTSSPLPEVQRRFQTRLGDDERAWQSAFELLAYGFKGDMPALLDAAERHETAGRDPDRPVDPSTPVSWMIRIAPEAVRLPLLRRLAEGQLRTFAFAGMPGAPLAQALVDTRDRSVWRRLLGSSYEGRGRWDDKDAVFERLFLTQDDPEVNEWLLTGLDGGVPHRRYRLAPSTRLALLEGRPFGAGAADPLPRTPAVHALIDGAAGPAPWEPDLLRICYDSREPGLAARALRASLDGDGELLTPYQQLIAAIRLWGSGRTGELRTLLERASEAPGIRDPRVRQAFGAARTAGSVQPLYDAASALREDADAHLDEALAVWGLRLPAAAGSRALGYYGQAELAAASRAVTGDRWYRVDWDLVRGRLADPEARHHRQRTRERHAVLLARADCPPDVAAALTHPLPGGLDLLRLYADRDTAVAALTRANAGLPGSRWYCGTVLVSAARPAPGWEPAVTPEDVLRHAHPLQGLLHDVPEDTIARAVAEFLVQEGIDTPLAEARMWLGLRRLTPYFAGPLPRLLRTAARLGDDGSPLDVVPAADFLVGPGPEEAVGLVRDRLGAAPGPWARAVRLLAAGFDGTLPELLGAACAEPPAEPGPARLLQGAAAALLALAPAGLADAVVGRLDVPTRLVLVRTTRDPGTLRALVRGRERLVWDALLDGPRVPLPSDPPYPLPYGRLRDEVLIPELLAQDDPWLNARLVREEFALDHEDNAARISAVLAGRPFGPARQPVPVLPGLYADFADWTPDSGAELPRWTRNPYLYTSPEPVLAMQALMAVRKPDRVDPPMTRLDVPQSLAATSTIAHAGRYDLLEYVAAHWHVRYPYGQHQEVRDLFARAARLRSAEELDEELTSRSA